MVPPTERRDIVVSQHLWSFVVGGVRYEGQIGDGAFSTNEPFLLRKHALEDTQYAYDLLLIPINCAGDLLRVEEGEPGRLAVIWPLTGGLEEEPLQLLELFFTVAHRKLALGVVFVSEVEEDRIRLPVETVIDRSSSNVRNEIGMRS